MPKERSEHSSDHGTVPRQAVLLDQARLLDWDDAMATGISAVDAEHRQLLDIFRRIAGAGEMSPDAIAGFLDELGDYSRSHFREEEHLMQSGRVSPEHRAMHLQAHAQFADFLRRTRSLIGHFLGGVRTEVLAFLAQWLLHHIMEVDQAMAREVQSGQGGAEVVNGAGAPRDNARLQISRLLGELSDGLGEKTLDLLTQQKKLLDLQALHRALLQSADVLIHNWNEQDILDSLCRRLTQEALFRAVWIGRPGDSGIFDVLALAGEGADQVRKSPPRLADGDTVSVAARAWNRHGLVVCNDTLSDDTLRPWHAEFAVHGWHSVLAIPVARAGQMWAILVFASSRPACFDAQTVEVCSRIGALLGYGLDEFDLKHRIRLLQERDARMARTDALTGLPNRFALEEYLPQAIARALRRGKSLAVGMMDLDDFKPINDQLGHEAGDDLLRRVSQSLLDLLRDSDFIARLGGDEFVVVLEDLDSGQELAQLTMALTRLHRAVETPFALGAQSEHVVSIDMSMGVALYPNDGIQAELLLRHADAAMYQAKQRKRDRAQWWALGAAPALEQREETSFDAFGDEAQELMRTLAPHLNVLAGRFTVLFYQQLEAQSGCESILASLSADELQLLKRKQASHLRFLLDPLATEDEVRTAAQRLGTVHGLIGVTGAWMTWAVGMYRDLLRAHLDGMLFTARTRYRILRAADIRLQRDLESQLHAMQSVLEQYQALLARPIGGRTLATDWIAEELDALAALPGMCVALVWRPDPKNWLVVERASGERADALVEAFRVQDLYPTLDPRDARGRGLVATTWRSDTQRETGNFSAEACARPWQELMKQFGIRSAATIPIHQRDTIHAVLMLFGAYPNQFSPGWMRTWRMSLQHRWDAMAAAWHRGRAIDKAEAANIRALLYGGGLEMFVQPVVDLVDGALVKVEGLARLRTPEGGILTPDRFLPALGDTDLDSLFRQGLTQGLGHLRRWRDQGMDFGLSINIAPSSLVHPDCARWIDEALREAGVAPNHLTLELLESQTLEDDAVGESIRRIASGGVRFALDDLGAGFSNLNRLARLPFQLIKIDQNIVKDLLSDPIKSLSLIRTLVQVGQDLEQEVVVEGLEDDGVIEAAIRLGCRLGQGYGLGRPMPAAELREWIESRSYRGFNDRRLHSWPGALAFEWMVMHDPLHLRHPGGLASCPITDFFLEQGVDDAMILDWHRQIHDELDESVRIQVKRSLLEWMARKIRTTIPDEKSA